MSLTDEERAIYEWQMWMDGFGDVLAGKMLHYDARTMDFRRITLQRNPECPVCGEAA